MNDLARKKLCDFINNYGPTVCSTPATCKMVLGQQCADFPAEKDLLLRALDRGAVTGVMKAPVGGPWDDLVTTVAGSSVAPADARWAVESWAIAMGKHPDIAPPPPEPVINLNAHCYFRHDWGISGRVRWRSGMDPHSIAKLRT